MLNQSCTIPGLDNQAIIKVQRIIRAVNHNLRTQIVEIVDQNKRMTVTEIYIKLRLEQAVASQHLAILRNARIVKTEREGKFIYYSVDHDVIAHINTYAKGLIEM